MTEHRIRLRAAWDRLDPGVEGSRRVDLPATWTPGDSPESFRLRRAFGRPRVGPGGAILLELADVPGLVAARLNGGPLDIGPEVGGVIRVDVGDRLDTRNVVELDVDLAGVGPGPWGSVALVVVGGRG